MQAEQNFVNHEISIHAPPRGATLRVFLCAIRHPYFNSRPSARGDHVRRVKPGGHPYFNSRPSARGDLRHAERSAARNFNSRPSARGDTILRKEMYI